MKTMASLLVGTVITLSSFAALAGTGPRPLPSGSSVYPRVHFIEGADLQLFRETYEKSLGEQRQEMVDQASALMFMGAGGEEAAKMLIAFDKHALSLRQAGRSRLGTTLEASFKAQLDNYYRQFDPPQRNLQFVANLPEHSYDAIIYGTYSVRPYGKPGLFVTLTVANLRTGETQSFEAEGEMIGAAQMLAGAIFHEYQKTRFPQQITLFGKKMTLLFKGAITRPTTSRMYELYKQAVVACEMRGGRVTTEEELTALATLGDYSGGVSVGQNGTPTYYWAVDYSRVYVAPWSEARDATNLNPTEKLNYLCVK